MNEHNKFDFVIYGATGFTGKLVVEYAMQKYSDNANVSWAIAGRNVSKLEELKNKMNLSDDIAIFEVDSDDQESIDNLVSKTKCVLTTVGPYQLYGENLIKTCAASGTDYVDLCGEPGFMFRIINECSAKAKETGSRIIFSCGFLNAQLFTLIFRAPAAARKNEKHI